MQLDFLRKLLVEPEGPTLEFKRHVYLDKIPRQPSEERIEGLDKKRQGEFAKDVMALANSRSYWGPWRYLVMGLDDDGTQAGIKPGHLSCQKIQQVLEKYCSPPVDCSYQEYQLGDLWFGLLSIPDSASKPHSFKTDVNYQANKRHRLVFREGEVYIRHLAEIRRATAEEIVALRDEARASQDPGRTAYRPTWRTPSTKPVNLLDLLDTEAQELAQRYESVRERVTVEYRDGLRPPVYMGDPVAHYESVCSRLDTLLPSRIVQTMSPEEIFCVLCAALVHDLGISGGRAAEEPLAMFLGAHNLRAQQRVAQESERLGLSSQDAAIIGQICYGLAENAIWDIPGMRPMGEQARPVRMQFLCALLRLADALDIRHHMATATGHSEETNGQIPIRVESDFQSWTIRVHCQPHVPEQIEPLLQVAEKAEQELANVRMLLHPNGLRFDRIVFVVDKSLITTEEQKQALAINPFRRLLPFTEHDSGIFFGRDEELSIALGKVCSYDIVTLLGESGVGKTSLLRAALIPNLESLGYQPIYARCFDDPAQRIRDAIARRSPELASPPDEPFSRFLMRTSRAFPKLVIIIDQAEELFTRVPSGVQGDFVRELAGLTADPHFSAKVVLALREDFAHRLFDLSNQIPAVYHRDYTVHLRRLTEEQANQALAGPVRGTPYPFEQDLIDAAIADLSQDGQCYPPDIQIVGHELYEQAKAKDRSILAEEYAELGGADEIIAGFFLGLVEDLPAPKQQAARDILKLLVSSYETKNQYSQDEITEALNHPAADVIEMLAWLVKSRLVNRLPERKFELVHDYLAIQIRQRWITEAELGIKRIQEMLRIWVHEWTHYGGEEFEHLLSIDQLNLLSQRRDQIRFTSKSLELVLLSALSARLETKPWVELMDPKSAVASLAKALEADRRDLYIPTLRALGHTGAVEAIKYLDRALRDNDKQVFLTALEALRSLPADRAVHPLAAALRREQSLARAGPIINALQAIGNQHALIALHKAGEHARDRRIRARTQEAYKTIASMKPDVAIKAELEIGDTPAVRNAIQLLEAVQTGEATQQVVRWLSTNPDRAAMVTSALRELASADDRSRVVRELLRQLAGAEVQEKVVLLEAVLILMPENEEFDPVSATLQGLPEQPEGLEGPQASNAEYDLARLLNRFIRKLHSGSAGQESLLISSLERIVTDLSAVAVLTLRDLVTAGPAVLAGQAIVLLESARPGSSIDLLSELAPSSDAVAAAWVSALEQDSSLVSPQSMAALRSLSIQLTPTLLARLLTHDEQDIRRQAMACIEQTNTNDLVESLASLTSHSSHALVALAGIGSADAFRGMQSALLSGSAHIRLQALRALIGLGQELDRQALPGLLTDSDPSVQREAMSWAAQSTDPQVTHYLDMTLDALDDRTKRAIIEHSHEPGSFALIMRLLEAGHIDWSDLVDCRDEVFTQFLERVEMEPLHRRNAVLAGLAREANTRGGASRPLVGHETEDRMTLESLFLRGLQCSIPAIRRIAAAALADMESTGLVPALKDKDSVVRRYAVQYVGTARMDTMADTLAKIFRQDPDQITALSAADSLVMLGTTDAISLFLSVLNDESPADQARILSSLEATDSPAFFDIVSQIVRRPDIYPSVRRSALEAFFAIPSPAKIARISAFLGWLDEEGHVQLLAAISHLEDEAVFQSLASAAKDENPKVRIAAMAALAVNPSRERLTTLEQAFLRDVPSVQVAAARALLACDSEETLQIVNSALVHERSSVRDAAMQALAESEGIPLLALLPSPENIEADALDPSIVIDAIQAAIAAGFRRSFEIPKSTPVRVMFDAKDRSLSVVVEKRVVDRVQHYHAEISLSEAQEIEPAAAIGARIPVQIQEQRLGRIGISTVRQVFIQRLREGERDTQFREHQEQQGKLVSAQIVAKDYHSDTVTLEHEGTALILPKREQVPNERYRRGQTLRVYVADARRTGSGSQLTVSRRSPALLRRLIELECPEVQQAAVQLKAIAREAGSRSKVAVHAVQDGIDPIGACVGVRGARIQRVVRELGGEKVDIVAWDSDPATFVANALSPAKVMKATIGQAEDGKKVARVTVPDRQLSLAIGKEGQNARLAAKLTGLRVDIKAASERMDEIMGETEEEQSLQPAGHALDLLDLAEKLLRDDRSSLADNETD